MDAQAWIIVGFIFLTALSIGTFVVAIIAYLAKTEQVQAVPVATPISHAPVTVREHRTEAATLSSEASIVRIAYVTPFKSLPIVHVSCMDEYTGKSASFTLHTQSLTGMSVRPMRIAPEDHSVRIAYQDYIGYKMLTLPDGIACVYKHNNHVWFTRTTDGKWIIPVQISDADTMCSDNNVTYLSAHVHAQRIFIACSNTAALQCFSIDFNGTVGATIPPITQLYDTSLCFSVVIHNDLPLIVYAGSTHIEVAIATVGIDAALTFAPHTLVSDVEPIALSACMLHDGVTLAVAYAATGANTPTIHLATGTNFQTSTAITTQPAASAIGYTAARTYETTSIFLVGDIPCVLYGDSTMVGNSPSSYVFTRATDATGLVWDAVTVGLTNPLGSAHSIYVDHANAMFYTTQIINSKEYQPYIVSYRISDGETLREPFMPPYSIRSLQLFKAPNGLMAYGTTVSEYGVSGIYCLVPASTSRKQRIAWSATGF